MLYLQSSNDGATEILGHPKHKHWRLNEWEIFTISTAFFSAASLIVTLLLSLSFELFFLVKEKESTILIPVQHKKQLTGSIE
jgi:hypothetical protein